MNNSPKIKPITLAVRMVNGTTKAQKLEKSRQEIVDRLTKYIEEGR